MEEIAIRNMRRKYTDDGFEEIFQMLEDLREAVRRDQMSVITRMPCSRICYWLDAITTISSDLRLAIENRDDPKLATVVERLLAEK